MTSEGFTAGNAALTDAVDARQFCYRHPDRETYVRCGRCDRPICTRCAMQGPVGFRCRQCGRPARDPLTSFTPRQVAAGSAIALAGGVATGLASAIGFLGLCIGLLAGGFAADRARRATGYKQGPLMLGIVFGGIALGTYLGYSLILGPYWPIITVYAAAAEAGIGLQIGGWAIFAGFVACIGAYWRLR